MATTTISSQANPLILAYHGQQALKGQAIAEMAEHRRLDHLVKGTYGNFGPTGWRGCMVGCLGQHRRHEGVQDRFGIATPIGYLLDRFFEQLPDPDSLDWPVQSLAAIQPGADLTLVDSRFKLFVLTSPALDLSGSASPKSREAIDLVASLLVRLIEGDEPSGREWANAYYASASSDVASSAASAATSSALDSASLAAIWSASAWAAKSSASTWAAKSSAWAAASAASAASGASAEAAWQVMAAELLRLLAAAPVSHNTSG
jgi:hypothetical protein